MNMIQISAREKRILGLAGAIALIFLATSVFPLIRGFYDDRQRDLEAMELDVSREIRLIEDTLRWRERRIEAESREAELEQELFNGETVPIIEANIQRALSGYARDSGISVNSTRLAERLDTDGWLLVSQEMSFNTNNAGNTVNFLAMLETSKPRLRVTDFSLTRSRAQYSGSITVVGFARSEGLMTEPAEER